MSNDNPNENFEELAQEAQPGIAREFVDFLKYNKKWWLLPIVLVVAIVAGLALFTNSAAAPFIYTMF